jgi:alkylhydroperoxidase family enzyme
MARIQVIEKENAKGKVKAVYEELSSVFGKVPGVMKALSPWPDMLELYSKVIGLIMLSETLLIRAVKEIIAELVSKINKCDYCLTYYKSLMVDLGLISPDAIAADYQIAAILNADKKVLAYVEKVTRHAYKTTDNDVDGFKVCGWSEGKFLEEQL